MALIAALSYTVAQTSRGSVSKLDQDKAKVYASEILEYANIISAAVTQLKLRGCRETEISFENNTDADYENNNAPTDNTCHLFHPAGGGIKWRVPDAQWLDSSKSASTHYGSFLYTASVWAIGFGIDGSGSACVGGNDECRELTFSLPHIDLNLCKEINKLTDHGQSDGTPFVDAGTSIGASTNEKFTGTFTVASNQIGSAVPSDDDFMGLPAGCIESQSNPAGSYVFYKILIAR